MAKTRVNRKELARLRKKQAFATATQVRLLAEQIQSQLQLDTCLLQCEDVEKRRLMFDFMKPFLKFHNPQFPTKLASSTLILP